VANIIAQIPGCPAEKPYVVLGAHYDTVPGSPGADDNASGVAVLLETARRMASNPSPPALRFVAFTLEEAPAFGTPLQGSRVFTRVAADNGDRILGAVVLEMVGYTALRQQYPTLLQWSDYPTKGDFIGVVGNRRSRELVKAVIDGCRQTPQLPIESLCVPFNGWILPDTRLSDHASFWDHGWPAVMVTDTSFFRNPNYHRPTDTLATLDFPFMAQLTRGLENTFEGIAEHG
jgi:Zn-dependent M28 family amino/carboxypeptidase